VEFQSVVRMTELENDDPNGRRSTERNTWFFKNQKFTGVPNIGYVESLLENLNGFSKVVHGIGYSEKDKNNGKTDELDHGIG
ncbi:hypothetical protein Tco_1397855, partial [Tanacetum coccineum]